MDYAVNYFPTHEGISPGTLARLVEEHGFSALLFAEHTHIPASRDSPWPGASLMPADRQSLPRMYSHTYDLFVALTDAAAATSRLRIGSGVCLLVERDPIITANAVASIDQLSGGRVDLGIGSGWNREEMANHGTDPRTRMRLMRERVEAMKAIWTMDEASYAGEFVNFDRIWCYPKPLQRPHPPILIGGAGERVIDRVLEYGDGWFPVYRDLEPERIRDLRARAGRDIYVEACGVPADPKALERCAEAGLHRVGHYLATGHTSHVERSLEQWEMAIATFLGG
jgi:probable F420-dependent oxidoreductase